MDAVTSGVQRFFWHLRVSCALAFVHRIDMGQIKLRLGPTRSSKRLFLLGRRRSRAAPGIAAARSRRVTAPKRRGALDTRRPFFVRKTLTYVLIGESIIL